MNLIQVTERPSVENIKQRYYVYKKSDATYHGAGIRFAGSLSDASYNDLVNIGISFNEELQSRIEEKLPNWKSTLLFDYWLDFEITDQSYAMVIINSDLRCRNIWNLELDDDSKMELDMILMDGLWNEPSGLFNQFAWSASSEDMSHPLCKTVTEDKEAGLYSITLSDTAYNLFKVIGIDDNYVEINPNIIKVYYDEDFVNAPVEPEEPEMPEVPEEPIEPEVPVATPAQELGNIFDSIATSIRAKTGSVEKMAPEVMAAEIDNISTGVESSGIYFSEDELYIGEDTPDASKYKYWINAPEVKPVKSVFRYYQTSYADKNQFDLVEKLKVADTATTLSISSGRTYNCQHYKDNKYIILDYYTGTSQINKQLIIAERVGGSSIFKNIEILADSSNFAKPYSTIYVDKENDLVYVLNRENSTVGYIYQVNILTKEVKLIHTTSYAMFSASHGVIYVENVSDTKRNIYLYANKNGVGATNSYGYKLVYNPTTGTCTEVSGRTTNSLVMSAYFSHPYEENGIKYMYISDGYYGKHYKWRLPKEGETNYSNVTLITTDGTVDYRFLPNDDKLFILDTNGVLYKYNFASDTRTTIANTGIRFGSYNSSSFMPFVKYNEDTKSIDWPTLIGNSTTNYWALIDLASNAGYYMKADDSLEVEVYRVPLNADVTKTILIEDEDSTNEILLPSCITMLSSSANLRTFSVIELGDSDIIVAYNTSYGCQAVYKAKYYQLKVSDGTNWNKPAQYRAM